MFGVAPDVLAWVRELEGQRVLVLLNVGDERRTCELPGLTGDGEVVAGTDHRRAGRIALEGLALSGLEGLALRL